MYEIHEWNSSLKTINTLCSFIPFMEINGFYECEWNEMLYLFQEKTKLWNEAEKRKRRIAARNG